MSEKKAPKLMTTTPNPRYDWILEDKMYNEFAVRFSEPISACFYFFQIDRRTCKNSMLWKAVEQRLDLGMGR